MLRSLLNQRLGRYYIKELLGRGGMAAVYRATDTILQRDVALKILYPHYSDDAALVQRFQREAVTAAALEHPHIVPVYDVGEQDSMAYIAMKLLDGETLHDRLQRVGTLAPAAVVAILEPVAAALDYAHRRGVIHRDIKPGNIFLNRTPDGEQVVLTDFGIAKQLDTPGLTTTGALIGTPDYMAPEQIAGGLVDARTDVYALGMLAYRALTGRCAFEGSTQDVLLGHLYQQAPAPSAVAPGLSATLDAPVLQAIARNPPERFATAGAFVQALRSAAAGAARYIAANAPTQIAPVAPPAETPTPVASGWAPVPVQPTGTATIAARTAPATEPQPAAPAPARRSPSSVPWILAILLAMLAGGLAVALGFSAARGSDDPAAGGAPPVPPPATETPTATPEEPTAPPTATPEEPTAPPTATPEEPSSTPDPGALPATVGPTDTPEASPSATATPEPTTTATATATLEPTATPTATATATATPSPEPTVTAECDLDLLQGGFERLYRDNVEVRTRLGCPEDRERAGRAAQQFFDRGVMYYWGLDQGRGSDTIWVLYESEARYEIYPPAEVAALPAPTPDSDPTAPVGGFGRIYFGSPGVAERLGPWRSPMIELHDRTSGVLQYFADGMLLYVRDHPDTRRNVIFVLYTDGTIARYND
jgi:serine/threonine-protein kinase